LDTENVVVNREHVEVLGGRTDIVTGNGDLRVVNSGEVAGTSWLVFFWLKRKRVRVNARVWVTRVVLVWLNLVKVSTGLFLESVLTVENQFEGIQVTEGLFREHLRGSRLDIQGWATQLVRGDISVRLCVWHSNEINRRLCARTGQIVHTLGIIRRRVRNAPHQFLNWVVVGQSDLLGLVLGNRIGTSVLDLFNQVFVTLLRESSALFSVEVDVVSPDLERGRGQVLVEVGRQVKVNSDFVVLQGNQWQGQSWVSVEEEDEWQVNGTRFSDSRGRHLTPSGSLGFIQVQFRVQSPPSLVVFVDSLTTDGQFGRLDRTLGDPSSPRGTRGGTIGLSGTELRSSVR
tara:strand:- start:121 stop:1152 length:1032 start_codon:yes stop_codon:yes gene_type:complete